MKRTALKVKTAIKSGRLAANHARAGLKVTTAVKAGGHDLNHSRTVL